MRSVVGAVLGGLVAAFSLAVTVGLIFGFERPTVLADVVGRDSLGCVRDAAGQLPSGSAIALTLSVCASCHEEEVEETPMVRDAKGELVHNHAGTRKARHKRPSIEPRLIELRDRSATSHEIPS